MDHPARADLQQRYFAGRTDIPFLISLRRYATSELPAPSSFTQEVGRHLKDGMPNAVDHARCRAARIGLQVLDALTAAHRAGVLHRDIKPHNVLIGEDGRVVLTDFGLATFVDDGSVTGPGLIVGSPQYVSPERARDGASTVESDLWSFGATLYAAVEGRSPYARESAMATLMALATEPPDRPEQAGLLAPVLIGLLRREPEARLTAAEVDRRLRMIIAAAIAEGAEVARAVVDRNTPGPSGGSTAGDEGHEKLGISSPLGWCAPCQRNEIRQAPRHWQDMARRTNEANRDDCPRPEGSTLLSPLTKPGGAESKI